MALALRHLAMSRCTRGRCLTLLTLTLTLTLTAAKGGEAGKAEQLRRDLMVISMGKL